MKSELPLNILLVEDDHELASSIQESVRLHQNGCEVVRTGASAIEAARGKKFDIVMVDLCLADNSGIRVVRHMREVDDNATLLIITPLSFHKERIVALECGADDFVIKPFSSEELNARIAAAGVRARVRPKAFLELGPLRMDLTKRRVERDDRTISLTPTEFRILEILLRNKNQVVTRRMLCESLWNPEWEGVTNVIEVHINRLRSKLKKKDEPQLIHTVRGSGYALMWHSEEGETRAAKKSIRDGARKIAGGPHVGVNASGLESPQSDSEQPTSMA